MMRTHNCGELGSKNIKEEVTLCGWCQSRRDHGGIIFIDLRDRWGLTQVVFDPRFSADVHKIAESLRREDVIQVKGTVFSRKEGMKNSKLKTGEIEIFALELNIITKAMTPPIEIDDFKPAHEEARLKYRYLDLRRPSMQRNMMFRHQVVKAAREFLDENEFIEITTPALIKSTPEGARDYVVPSRVHPGFFYSLPQSPQLYKQLLMLSGFDRYYQLPICFRDEGVRSDRQPEHTQIDIEMSFVSEEDIFELTENMLKHIFSKVMGKELKTPFRRIAYSESMAKYGIDKPDLRFGLELCEITDIAAQSEFKIFLDVIEKKGIVKAINAKGCMFNRRNIEEYVEYARSLGYNIAWMKMTDKLESNITKFFSDELLQEIVKRAELKEGDVLFIAGGEYEKVNDVLAKIRLRLGDKLGLINKDEFEFCFITDFPLFEFKDGKWDAMHNPFSMPKVEHIPLIETHPEKVLSRQYDLVINGSEIYSGSIRNYSPQIQERVMKVIGITKEQAEEKFGFLLEAYKYGAPVHGGFAIGLDRLVATFLGISDIREVIAFPKTKSAECPMDGCPSPLDEDAKNELHIDYDEIARTNLSRQTKKTFHTVKVVLDKLGLKYKHVTHEKVKTSEDAAQIRGTELGKALKAIIFSTSRGFIMGICPADKKIDEDKLSKAAGVESIRLAKPEDVKKQVGCEIGAVPPFGSLFGLKTYADISIKDIGSVVFSAGSHTDSIFMEIEDFLKASSVEIREIC